MLLQKKLKIIILIFFFLLSPISICKAELINRDELINEINNQANNQISQISVQNTGDNENSNSSSSSNDETTVNNNNEGNLNQTTNADANSGTNEASRNISFGGDAGMIQTGNASVNVQGIVSSNGNETIINNPGDNNSQTTSIENTGSDLTSTNSSTSANYVLTNNNNTTYISQITNAQANTGNNKADRNISFGGNSGVITTGNAGINVNYLVTANGNVALIGGQSNGIGPGSGASILILNTGDRGNFNRGTSETNYITVNNNNLAEISQSCGYAQLDTLVPLACIANTGNNISDRAIAFGGDAGVIETGDATVNVLMFANVNNDGIQVNNIDNCQNPEATIDNTGDDVHLNNESECVDSSTINNNNKASVNQNITAIANTGGNHANRNISFGGNAGIIKTGNATVNVTMAINANNNGNTNNTFPAITPTPNPTTSPTPTPGTNQDSQEDSNDNNEINEEITYYLVDNNSVSDNASTSSSDPNNPQILSADSLPTTGIDRAFILLFVELFSLSLGIFLRRSYPVINS